MALRIIVQDGDPVLKKKCRPVAQFDERLATLLDDMAETMLDSDGLGLAGPQVGVMRRLFVAVEDQPPPEDWKDGEGAERSEAGRTGSATRGPEGDELPAPRVLEFINPEILEEEGATRGYEGCLSFPGRYAAIERPVKVKIRAFDRHGEPFTYEGEGMMARCLCHETNHLDGVTIDELAEYYYDPEVPHDLDDTLLPPPEDDEV